MKNLLACTFAFVSVWAQVACGGALGDYLGGKGEKSTAEWQMLNHYERWQVGKERLEDYPYLPKLVKLFDRNYGGKPKPMPIPEEPRRELLAAQAVENSSRWISPARPGTAISSSYSRLI